MPKYESSARKGDSLRWGLREELRSMSLRWDEVKEEFLGWLPMPMGRNADLPPVRSGERDKSRVW